MLQLHKTCRVKGVASSDVYMYDSTRGDADSLATLVRQHYHGLLKWPPFGRLPRPLPACLHTGSRMAALRASTSPIPASTRAAGMTVLRASTLLIPASTRAARMTVLRAFCLHVEHYRGISTCSSNSING